MKLKEKLHKASNFMEYHEIHWYTTIVPILAGLFGGWFGYQLWEHFL